MGKNKQRKKPQRKERPEWLKELEPQNISPEDKAKAIGRLKELFTALAAPAETVLEMLDRLGIPHYKETYESMALMTLDEDDPHWLIIRWKDLEKGEKRNEPLIKRIYKEENSDSLVE